MKVVSINGRDGVGKSEQVNLLGIDDRFNLTGGLISHSSRWVRLGPVESFNWWFRDLPFLELVSIILESLKARRANYKSDKINVNDRGSRMFKAVCAATLVTREKMLGDEAIRTVDELFKEELRESEFEQDVLFQPDPKYMSDIGKLIQLLGPRDGHHLSWQTEMYAKYQASLVYFIDYYYRGLNPENMICVDGCILDTHDKLQKILGRICEIDLQPLCGTLEKLVAFGGLSECGKSSFAEQISTHHHFYRLKIKYFGGVVRGRGQEVKPTTLGRELLDFFRSHRHITRASIESLHGAELPAYLKLLFGSRLKIVYIDTSEDIRVRRTVQELGISFESARLNTATKDALKLSRGADKVRDIADIVFNNDCDDLETSFHAFVSQI